MEKIDNAFEDILIEVQDIGDRLDVMDTELQKNQELVDKID